MISGNSAVPTVKMAGEVKKPLSGLKKKQPETVKEFLDNPASYPYEMRLGAYLAWKEGKGEWLTLEREFERKMLRERGECCHSDLKDELDLNYDVGSMEDEEVMAEIRGWENGPKINARRNPWTGDKEYYIVLLAMSPQQPLPTGSYQRKAAKEEKQPSGTESKPRAEVHNFNDFLLNLIKWCL